MAYIPTKDAEIVQWGRNFSDRLTATPATYGLEAADAAIVQNQFNIFNLAYEDALDPSTRTRVTIADKDGEKLTFLQLVRQYAAIIRANAGVTNEDKAALGLTIPDPTPTPVPVPATSPLLTVTLSGVGVHQMSVTDQLTPEKKAKPQGVAGCILYMKSGATIPASMDDAPVAGLLTKCDNIIDTSAVTNGHYVSYRGQWYNRKGQLGPMGDIMTFIKT
jgi:hypothetical protein